MAFFIRGLHEAVIHEEDGPKLGSVQNADGSEPSTDEEDEYKMGDTEEESDDTTDEEASTEEETTEDTSDEDEDSYSMSDEEDEDDYSIPEDEEGSEEDNTEEETGSEDGGATSDDTSEDDYSMSDEEGSEDGGEESTGEEDTSTDDDTTDEESGTGLSSQIADIEEKIYQDLTDEEKMARVFELKANCSKIYSDCVDIIEQLSNVTKTSYNQDVIDTLIQDLVNLKQYALEYVTNVFDSKSYTENKVWFNKTQVVMTSVKNVLEELVKQSNKQIKNVKEATLTTKKRNNLKDSDFGLPKERKFPIHDKSHVKSAIRYFSDCPEKKKPQLAKRIIAKAKEFGVEISENNPILKYK